MGVWNELVTARMNTYVVTIHPTGAEADAERAASDGPALEMAEVLSVALSTYGVLMPANDEQMAAVLARDGLPADPALLTRGTVVALASGRLGLACGRGAVIEPAGESLTRITAPEQGRYTAGWFIPGVDYVRSTP